MSTSTLNSIIADQNVAHLRHAAQRRRLPDAGQDQSGPAVELRLATANAADAAALTRLAELDDAPIPRDPVLMAVVDLQPQAALSLHDGQVLANPWVRTDDLVVLLRLRARHLTGVPTDRQRRLRLPRLRVA